MWNPAHGTPARLAAGLSTRLKTLPESIIDDLKSLISSYPGDCEVVLEVQMSAGDPRTLRLGPSYKVAPTPTLRAELEQVLGPAALAVSA